MEVCELGVGEDKVVLGEGLVGVGEDFFFGPVGLLVGLVEGG
jgi:hypothetical protein